MAILCKYFAQGTCRYGDRCHYQHSVGGGAQGGGFGGSNSYHGGGARANPFKLDNRYSALNNSSAGNRSLFGGGNENNNPLQSVTDIISSISTEMLTWEQSGMWLFSTFFHSKETNCQLPGFDDYSQEELRHEAYSENPKPQLQINYKAKERQLVNDVREKIAKLKNPDHGTKQQLTAFVELARQQSGTVSTTSTSSPFGVAAVTPGPTSTASAAAKSAEETLTAIGTEVSTWVRSGMWLLSEYCSSKESPTIPGFKDMSPEELRFEAYAENPSPHLQTNAKVRERGLLTEARMKIEQLRNPDPETKQLLLLFYPGRRGQVKDNSMPFDQWNWCGLTTQLLETNIAFLAQTPSKTHVATVAPSGGGLFGASGSQKSLFGDPHSGTPTSVFGGSGTTSSIFGGSSQNAPINMSSNSSVFGNSAFGGTNNSSTGLFGKSASTTTEFGQGSASTGLFGKSTPSTGLFGNSSNSGAFGKASASPSSTGLFGKPDLGTSGLFGKTTDSSQATGLFGTSSNTGAFGKASGSSSSTGLFGKPDSGDSGLFGKTTDSSPGLFGKPAQSGLFGKPATVGLFGDTNAATTSQGLTASGGNQQGPAPVAKDQPRSLPLYTLLQDLSEAERAEFDAPEFTLGRIPTLPPAKEHVV